MGQTMHTDGFGSSIGALRPFGLVLSFSQGEFRIRVVDQDGETAASLGPYAEDEVIAVWRQIAARSGLALLFVAPDGTLRHLYPQIGPVRLGDRRDGRRLGVLAGRRPRFLVRRKPARLPRRPQVFGGREIASGRSG